jgi:uncharacterized membrane protein HdeD (DUF308 family)
VTRWRNSCPTFGADCAKWWHNLPGWLAESNLLVWAGLVGDVGGMEMISNRSQSVGRGWLVGGGVLSLVVGVAAVALPGVFGYVLTAFLGALCLVSGIFGLAQVVFGKGVPHRVQAGLSALVRLAAGVALFVYTGAGVEVLTLILALVFLLEGGFAIGVAMATGRGRGWMLLNGVAAVVLAVLVFLRWPGDSAWVIGTLYGVQSILNGVALLMAAGATRKE